MLGANQVSVKCPICQTEMLPLATSVYCPRDCDRTPAARRALVGHPIVRVSYRGKWYMSTLIPVGGTVPPEGKYAYNYVGPAGDVVVAYGKSRIHWIDVPGWHIANTVFIPAVIQNGVYMGGYPGVQLLVSWEAP